MQHPIGHEVASQTHLPWATLHSWSEGHAAHATPPFPHAALLGDATQCPVVSQQPLGHVVASQTHAPFRHRWPAAHAPQSAPQEGGAHASLTGGPHAPAEHFSSVPHARLHTPQCAAFVVTSTQDDPQRARPGSQVMRQLPREQT